MANVHLGPRVYGTRNYTRKQIVKPPVIADNLGELRIELSSPSNTTRTNSRVAKAFADRLEKERRDYKDTVKRGICTIHRVFTKKNIKHKPFFNCTIRARILCHRCGHKGHMTRECLLMDSSMKTQAKKTALGVMGATPWLGKEGNYAEHYTFEKGVRIPDGPKIKSQPKIKAQPKIPPPVKSNVSAMPDYNAMTKEGLMEILERRGFTRSTKPGQLRGPQAKRAWLIQMAKKKNIYL